MKFSKTLKRCIAGTIVLCHAGVLSMPAMAAIEQEAFGRVKPGTEGSVSQSDLEQMQELVKKMQMRLIDLRPSAKTTASQLQKLNQQQETLRAATAKQILELRSNIAQETARAVTSIRQEAQQFKAKKVSSTILDRQEQTAKLIEQRQVIMEGLFDQLVTAKDTTSRNAALDKISNQMTQWEPKKLQRDFKELPWGRPDSKVPAPVTAQDFKKLAPALKHYQVKNDKITINPKYKPVIDASTLSPDQLWQQAIPTVFTSTSVGQWQKIAFNGMTLNDQNKWPVLASLPVATQTEDLTANEDVQITQEIKDLAAQLNHNPAKIYKWVYDNIEFIPTYGSIQGSAYTLETKRGNATDTSSLLIALLRASGIPARYVSGTIDVPAEVAKDWVGGVNNLSAAGNLIGQGGVPSVIMISGGKETHLRMEHMWVEAKLDFIPSKGAVQTSGQNNPNIEDSWVPLDASYKRYERINAIDLNKELNLNLGSLQGLAKQDAEINNNYVRNINVVNINNIIEVVQKKMENYFLEIPVDKKVGDILGGVKIIPYKSKMLSPTLPYDVVAVVRDYHTIPDTMRHYFVIKNNDLNFRIPTTRLNGGRLALSFEVKDKSNADALLNYLPKNESGNINPTVSSSIYMVPQISLNEVNLMQGNMAYQIGSDINFQMGFLSPNTNSSLITKSMNVGEYHAIGYFLNSISKDVLSQTKQEIIKTNEILSKDVDAWSKINKHQYIGLGLQSVVQSYFYADDKINSLSQRVAMSIVNYNNMSFGTYFTNISPIYSWGVLRQVKHNSVTMDLDRLSSIGVDKNNNNENIANFSHYKGYMQSLMENWIPEQALNYKVDSGKAEGVSATKILDFAAKNGQKIYNIDLNNADVISSLNQDSSTLNDVRNAVYSGKTVYIHESTINYNGWKGAGYIVIDKNTGSSAYMISGGLNGGDTSLPSSSDILAWVGGLLAGADIGTKYGGQKPIFSDSLIKKYLLNKNVALIGYLALAVGLWDSWDSDKSICYNALGVSTNLLGFIASFYIVALFSGPIGILLGLLLAAVATLVINAIGSRAQKAEYFETC